MAKETPYFQFQPAEWRSGDVAMCSLEAQGLFINICATYWERECEMSEKQLRKRYGRNAVALDELIEDGVLKFDGGSVKIGFLDRNLAEIQSTSKTNSRNAKEGWKKRKANKPSERNATASKPQSQNDAIREDKIRGDKKREEENTPHTPQGGLVVVGGQELMAVGETAADFEKFYSLKPEPRKRGPTERLFVELKNRPEIQERGGTRFLVEQYARYKAGCVARGRKMVDPDTFLKSPDNYLADYSKPIEPQVNQIDQPSEATSQARAAMKYRRKVNIEY